MKQKHLNKTKETNRKEAIENTQETCRSGDTHTFAH